MSFYYYKVIRKTIVQFLDIFNNIQIAKYNKDDGTVREMITVPLKFAPKDKAYAWLHDRSEDAMLPMMAVNLTSVEHAVERVGSTKDKITQSTTSSTISQFLNPVPYNFSFDLSIVAKYMVDVDQILEQILPNFNPIAQMRVRLEEIDYSFDTKIHFTGASPDLSLEIPEENYRLVAWTLGFTVQGYLFKPVSTSGIIKEIIVRYFTKLGNASDWVTGTSYEDTDMVKVNDLYFRCIREHTSKTASKPTIGDDWKHYWIETVKGTSGGWGSRDKYLDGSTLTTFTSGASGWEDESQHWDAIARSGDPDVANRIFYDSTIPALFKYEIFD